MKALVNVGMYQSIWFLCVFFGNIGAVGGLLLIVVHFAISDRKKEDLQMTGLLLLLGLFVDGTLSWIGFFSFTQPGFPIPFWLMVIWLGLAITPCHSLAWMQHKPLLSVLFGAVGGPLAYWAGVRLGAASFHWELGTSLVVLGVVWGILWTAIMWLSTAVSARWRISQGLTFK